MDRAMNRKLMGLLAGFGLLLNAGTAGAVVIYDWSGNCTQNCTGTATAVLTLGDSYTPGTPLLAADFISFSYSSSSGSYDVPGDADFLELIGSTGALPVLSGVTLTGPINLDFVGTGTTFSVNTDGTWGSGFTPILAELDAGNSHIWERRIPEPATLALFGLGLAGLGAVRWKKLAV